MAGCIADLQAAMAAMSEDPCNRSRLYLTDRELAALPCMAHDTVFAVRWVLQLSTWAWTSALFDSPDTAGQICSRLMCPYDMVFSLVRRCMRLMGRRSRCQTRMQTQSWGSDTGAQYCGPAAVPQRFTGRQLSSSELERFVQPWPSIAIGSFLDRRIMLKSQKDPIDLWLVSTSHEADQPAATPTLEQNGAPGGCMETHCLRALIMPSQLQLLSALVLW